MDESSLMWMSMKMYDLAFYDKEHWSLFERMAVVSFDTCMDIFFYTRNLHWCECWNAESHDLDARGALIEDFVILENNSVNHVTGQSRLKGERRM